MRIIVIQQAADLEGLGTRLGGANAPESGLEQLQRLNPHVDFKRIEPGTVLLVPDHAGLKKGEGSSVGGQAFDAFGEQVSASVQAAAQRVQQGHDARTQQRQEVGALLKTAALKRLVEADPDLKPQVEAAAAVFKQDQQEAKQSQALLKTLQEGAMAELDALGKLLS